MGRVRGRRWGQKLAILKAGSRITLEKELVADQDANENEPDANTSVHSRYNLVSTERSTNKVGIYMTSIY